VLLHYNDLPDVGPTIKNRDKQLCVYTDYYINRTDIAPSLLHVDIDRLQFETVEQEAWLQLGHVQFSKILGSQPTQLWTGRGHHYIEPQTAIVLEKRSMISKSSSSPQGGSWSSSSNC